MPAKISKEINKAVEEKLSSLTIPETPSDAQNSAIANMIAGSGLNLKKFRRR